MGGTCGKNGRRTAGRDSTGLENGGEERLGRRRLRWDDYVKRNLEGVGEEWEMSANDRGVETVGIEGSAKYVMKTRRRRGKFKSRTMSTPSLTTWSQKTPYGYVYVTPVTVRKYVSVIVYMFAVIDSEFVIFRTLYANLSACGFGHVCCDVPVDPVIIVRK